MNEIKPLSFEDCPGSKEGLVTSISHSQPQASTADTDVSKTLTLSMMPVFLRNSSQRRERL